MKYIFISLFTLIFSITTIVAEELDGIKVVPLKPIDVDVDFQTSYFKSKPWIKEFHYVIVINKAEFGLDSQTIKVYEYGYLILQDLVSTGRDEYEFAGEHYSLKDSWTVTQTGYYTPTFLNKNHKSSAYGRWHWLTGGTKMPYSIFFNGGIALHQAPKGTESLLGQKASGGCIRLKEEVASELFERIRETQGSRIPKFNVDGTIVTDAKGNYSYNTSAFSALIIVKNKTEK